MIQIKNWNETFENADTRKRQRLGWFLCPTGTDSAGYIELMSHGERGIRAFAVFTAICQWSATCVPVVRGSCARSDGRAMSARQIATVIRMPENIVTDALELLASEDVGWILCENTDVSSVKAQSAGSMPVPCQSPAGSVPQGEGEGKGEGKGKDKPRAAKVFVAPSVADVASWIKEQGFTVNAEAFVDYYTANGWMVGRNKMKDWKATVRNWQRNNPAPPPKKLTAQQQASILWKKLIAGEITEDEFNAAGARIHAEEESR